MFTKESIEQLSKAEAITAADKAMSGVSPDLTAVALPNDFTLHDLESYLPQRRRARGQMATSSLAAFAAYLPLHAENGAAVFVDADAMSATAVLNLGAPDAPGHADNCATFTAKKTAAFMALQAIANGGAKKQSDVAEFIEDWAPFVKCSHDGVELATPKAIAAVRDISIESLRKVGAQEGQLSATRSAFEKVEAKGAEQIPTVITFTAKPYADLPARAFALRLSILTTGDKPAITLRVINAEQHAEEMAAELVLLVTKAIDDKLPVLIGTYKARG